MFLASFSMSPPFCYRCRFFSSYHCLPLDLHSFPTRRSSDLPSTFRDLADVDGVLPRTQAARFSAALMELGAVAARDRKSTRLNSSHVRISYAVFCLKKKKGRDDAATASDENVCVVISETGRC